MFLVESPIPLSIIFITIKFSDERTNVKEEYHFEGGIAQYVADLNKKQEVAKVFEFNTKIEDIEFDIALMYNDTYDEKVYSFVNNIRTPNGGTHEAGFKPASDRTTSMAEIFIWRQSSEPSFHTVSKINQKTVKISFSVEYPTKLNVDGRSPVN